MTLMRQGYLTNQITAGGGSGSLFLLLKGLEEDGWGFGSNRTLVIPNV